MTPTKIRSTNARLVRRVLCASALLVGAATFAACGSSSPAATSTSRPASSTTAPPATEALDVKLVDYGFESPSSTPAGYVDLHVTNTGKQQHEVQLGRLNQGVTWDQVEQRLHGPAPDSVALMVTFVGGTAPVEPGGSATTTVHLDEGDYGVFCFIVGWDGTSHLAHGMAKPLEATAAEGASTAPKAKGTIVLKDMAIQLPKGFDGTGTWKVVNEGPQPHQALIMQYADGATDDDVQAYLKATSPPKVLPALAVGGAGAIAKGQEEWIHLDLPKGKTLWLCVVPDTTKGMLPHFMEGMQTTFVKS